jgi:hypothetical protein
VQSYQPEVVGQDLGDPRPKGTGTAALVSVVRRRCDTRRRTDVVGPASPSRCGAAAGLFAAQQQAGGTGGRRVALAYATGGRGERPAAGVRTERS